MEEVLFKIRDLNKVFHLGKMDVYALKDVNVDIYQGEYLSVMGPSGSGKSTLFNMIGALDRPSSGTITVAGIDLTKLSSRELAYFRGNHIGYVFQAYNIIYSYTAIDNVALPMLFSGKSQSEAEKRAKEVLEMVGLGHRMTHRPGEMSGGQQQRVAIARALANEPAIILADEPTANLDTQTGEDIIQLLSKLSKEAGVTVVTATHDHKMLATSDRIVWIKDGQVDRVQLRSELDIRLGAVH
ncbi:MAG TPA: ABC transporter ATP-binding protein [Armatimonadota bacterium]|nr:ABC transporter ATP-binding protein [Armatimonadota bacterium]